MIVLEVRTLILNSFLYDLVPISHVACLPGNVPFMDWPFMDSPWFYGASISTYILTQLVVKLLHESYSLPESLAHVIMRPCHQWTPNPDHTKMFYSNFKYNDLIRS